MPQNRSLEMFLAGFYLAKFGRIENGKTLPPERFDTEKWSGVYLSLFARLGEGRSASSFANSLKNVRDMFDAHLDSGRVGWQDPGESGRTPGKLTGNARKIWQSWNERSEDEVWQALQDCVDAEATTLPRSVEQDFYAELESQKDHTVRSEGGQRVAVSVHRERDPRLRAAALRIHGYACQACGFDFERIYGPWGKEFAEVHHRQPLAESGAQGRQTDPRTDLVVLCGNCHRMVHRKRKIALTIEELKAKLDRPALAAWARQLQTPE